jgi:imidazoleglycerol-phosphate dehydratase/histidinol-phosphatase
MSAPAKILFVDRDGTLIEEPADEQIDGYEKFRLLPGAIGALRRLVDAGYELVMVTNQDGLGTPAFPEEAFAGPQRLLLEILAGEGIVFREVLVDRSFAHEHAPTRKPGLGLVRHYLGHGVLDRARSAVIGDRDSDLEFARNIGVRGLRIGADAGWAAIATTLLDAPRRARIERTTRETRIAVEVDLDDAARPAVHSGIGFLDHMIEQLGVHGGFALRLRCDGDLGVDEHHTVEDCALALGQALREALGERRGIGRYGHAPEGLPLQRALGFVVPMDDALAHAALDLSGRPYFVFEGAFPAERVGALPSALVPHFFRSLADALGANLHLAVRGDDAHHMVEACFKVVGRARRQAIRRDGGVAVPSSKGVLAGAAA